MKGKGPFVPVDISTGWAFYRVSFHWFSSSIAVYGQPTRKRKARAIALVSAMRRRWGAIILLTFLGDASPCPVKMALDPSFNFTDAVALNITKPVSLSRVISSVVMLKSPLACANVRRPANLIKVLPIIYVVCAL